MYEKSCGFVVYRVVQDKREYLIIRASNGEYGFPKGHIENNETEYETAIRELKEETNIEVQIVDGFREQIEYPLINKKNVMKQSVYFLGKWLDSNIVCQETEVSEAMFVSIEKALELLPFEDTKNIIKKADAYICSNTVI